MTEEDVANMYNVAGGNKKKDNFDDDDDMDD